MKFVVSTTTTTGMGELQRKLEPHISKIYYPIDRRKFVTRALNTIRPEAVVLVEAEIWPNFLWRAQDIGIPLFLVNARLSEVSFRRYVRCGFLFRSVFASFAGVGVQNDRDVERLKTVGCKPEAIKLTGNMKFDAATQAGERRPVDAAALLRQIAVPPSAKILVAGSTHAGEEKILAEQFVRLKKKFPDLFFVLVPRHFERAKEVARDLQSVEVKFVSRTEVDGKKFSPGEIDCLLVNTTGELKFFYEQATVVFVGKSLTAKGGQNPIEPGALGKAMVFGPNMQNFTDVTREFLAADGAVQVGDAAELEKTLADLLENPKRREQLGENALAVVRKNQGAINRTVEMILEHLDNGEIYVRR